MTGSTAAITVEVVMVNYRTPELTMRCIESLRGERASLAELRALVVDGGSDDNSAARLAEGLAQPEYRDWVSFLPLPLNGGFGWANNQGIVALTGQEQPPQFIHLLNPDTEVEPGAIHLLAEYLRNHERVAAVGSQLLEMDGSWTGSAFSFPSIRGEFSRGARSGALNKLLRVPPVAIAPSVAIEVDWATGASVMFRLDALRQVGLFDEGFFLYHEEIELMWRLRKRGWTIATEPRSRVRHVGGGSTGVHSRPVSGLVEPRKPRYWYRSRSRFFSLSAGPTVAMLAFFSWLFGYLVWRIRRVTGTGGGSKPIERQLRDHIAYAFPRTHDAIAAIARAEGPPSSRPAWMTNRWL